MNPEKAAQNLAVIRQLMERPVRCSVQSGLAGILVGCIALAGLKADYYFSQVYSQTLQQAFWINVAVWSAVLVLSAVGAIGLMHHRERRMGVPFWTPAKRKVLMTIAAPFFAAAGLTAAIAYRWYAGLDVPPEMRPPNEWGLIFPCWMLFYGIACWQVGELSIREIRVMGAAFVLAGIVSAAFFQATIPSISEPGSAPYWTMGVTFGGFHIVYGIVVWIRHGG